MHHEASIELDRSFAFKTREAHVLSVQILATSAGRREREKQKLSKFVKTREILHANVSTF